MEQATVNTVLTIVIGLYAGLLSWIFLDNRNNTNRKIDEAKLTAEKELEDLKRKLEITDAHLREFENVKFQEIMTILNKLTTDVAVIRSEMSNLKTKE